MNERIRKLSDEAGFVRFSTEEDSDTPIDWSSDYSAELEKFAELIVRECLNNMENCDGDLDFGIWKTKQDFGVK
jgi:hypothetical protein